MKIRKTMGNKKPAFRKMEKLDTTCRNSPPARIKNKYLLFYVFNFQQK